MKILLENVGSIKNGEVEIVAGCLNIKYAANGTGKSSIAGFLKASIEEQEDIKKRFVPFGTTETPQLSFEGGAIKTCLVFDEDYIERFLFLDDDRITDALRLVKMSPDLTKAIDRYDAALADLKASTQDLRLREFVDRAEKVHSLFSTTEKGELRKGSKLVKATANGCNVLRATDQNLQSLAKQIESAEAADWRKWWVDGAKYKTDKCPFCGQPLSDDFARIQNALESLFGQIDAKKNVETRRALTSVAADLSEHAAIDELLATTSVPTESQYKTAVKELLIHIEVANKIDSAARFSPLDFRRQSLDKTIEKLDATKVDLSVLTDGPIKDAFAAYNQRIDDLLAHATNLTEIVKDYDSQLSKLIGRFMTFINEYLRRCGIPYSFKLIQEGENKIRAVLESGEALVPGGCLSYGERNCLCFALFMLEVSQTNPDLIILDDPISSFDAGKRFSMFSLAYGPKPFSLKEKTVVLFTHDATPLIDFVKRTSKGVGNRVKGWKMINVNGRLQERRILPEDIDSMIAIEKHLASDTSKILPSRLVHARRYFEAVGDESHAYDVISSLFHDKPAPDRSIGHGQHALLTDAEICEAFSSLADLSIVGDYSSLRQKLSDQELCVQYKTASSYGKMAIARLLLIRKPSGGNVGEPFDHILDALFHIEQETLFSCAHFAEESIPPFIVDYVDFELKQRFPVLAD